METHSMSGMGKVVFLGVEGAGKSVLTVALATYLLEHEDIGWSLRPENKEAFVFSERMPKRFAAGELPAQTATFRHLRWSICYNDEPQRTLDVLDYPGEIYRLAFLDPAEDSNPAALLAKQQAHKADIRELMDSLRGAGQVFVLFNIDDAKNLETDNANIDAVWITRSALKILSSLPNPPELTLLITQADRLESEGEQIGDVDAVVQKYLPLIGRSFKGLKKLMVSAKNYNDERFGLLPLVSSLLKNTELYEKSALQWETFRTQLKNGTSSVSEYDRLAILARPFAWISEGARFFVESTEEWEEFLSVKGSCQDILSQVKEEKAQIKAMETLLQTVKYEGSKKHIEDCVRIPQTKIENQSALLLMLLFGILAFAFCVGAPLIVSILSNKK